MGNFIDQATKDLNLLCQPTLGINGAVGVGRGDADFHRCMDMLRQKPPLAKFQTLEGIETVKCVQRMYESAHFGGSILTPLVFEYRNPLVKRLEAFMATRPQLQTDADVNKFFCLPNIQWKRGHSKFFDIWIFIDKSVDSSQLRSLEDLHSLSKLKAFNWEPQMLYPYTNQFLLWDDIKESLNGVGRIIEYRCFSKNQFGEYDPSLPGQVQNTIIKVMEGFFVAGEADGFQRHYMAQTGHCRLGFFSDDRPFGKFVELDIQGAQVQQLGIYRGDDFVQRLHSLSFEDNIEPDQESIGQRDFRSLQAIQKSLHQEEGSKAFAEAATKDDNRSCHSSDSNLTEQEEELEKEREKLLNLRTQLWNHPSLPSSIIHPSVHPESTFSATATFDLSIAQAARRATHKSFRGGGSGTLVSPSDFVKGNS